VFVQVGVRYIEKWKIVVYLSMDIALSVAQTICSEVPRFTLMELFLDNA